MLKALYTDNINAFNYLPLNCVGQLPNKKKVSTSEEKKNTDTHQIASRPNYFMIWCESTDNINTTIAICTYFIVFFYTLFCLENDRIHNQLADDNKYNKSIYISYNLNI